MKYREIFPKYHEIFSKYHVIFLDVDDTLLDFEQAEQYALEKTCQHVGYPYSEAVRVLYKNYNTKLWDAIEAGEIDMATLKRVRFKEFVKDLQINYDYEPMSELYMAYLGEADFEIEGAYEMCQMLSKKYPLAVVTNGITKVQQRRFEKSRLKPFIQQFFISEEIGYSKPNPKIFEYAMQKMQISNPKKVLMIGDSLTSDMQGGYNTGIDTCFYNPKGKQRNLTVTYEVKHLSEVISLLDKE